jgi:hypothetical protein
VLATQVLTSPATGGTERGCRFYNLNLLASGEMLVGGYYEPQAGSTNSARTVLASYQGPSLQPGYQELSPNLGSPLAIVHEPDGRLTVGGGIPYVIGGRLGITLKHYASQGLPYAADLCQTPPQANAAFVIPPAAPDSLNLFDISDPGPQYGQLVRWRWVLGDGTVVERGQPGWVRHKYAVLPPAGTPVTLTVTNNLGCTNTQTLYPFGLPSASQLARELAGRAVLYPNPASGAVTLSLSGAPGGAVTVAVVNALGQVVLTRAGSAAGGSLTLALEVSQLAAGVYAVRVTTSQGSFVKRLVRQ